MIEIQCTSCHTRYRIDERVLPDDTPTFKCSRCGHVFTAEPMRQRARKSATPEASESLAPDPEPRPKRMVVDDVAAAQPPPPKPAPPKPEPRDEPALRSEAPPPPQDRVEARPPAPEPVEARRPAPEPPPLVSNQPEPPPPSWPPTDEIFNKSFAEQSRPDTGENLKFDFNDERREVHDETGHEVPREDEGWQVGDAADIEPASIRARPGLDMDMDRDEPEPPPPSQSRQAPPQKFYQPLDSTSTREAAAPRSYIPDDMAFIEDSSPIRSAGWFLAMFFIVAVGFFGLSMTINGAPLASATAISKIPGIGSHFARPMTPAMMVKLGDVHTEYRTLKGGKSALVVSGNAENVSEATLHAIGIEVLLLNKSQRTVARAQTYCGNTLAATMFAEMTPRELEFSLGLNPPKNFSLDPSQATPFMLVFVDPPLQANSLRIAVTQADPPTTASGSHS